MKKFLIIFLIFSNSFGAIAKNLDAFCKSDIQGYRVVKGSIYPFMIGQAKACFFAFYTKNPNPMVGSRGNGNLSDALWYGYYMSDSPSNLHEFPKPSQVGWEMVCSISAVSFLPMHGGKKRDVTVIGSCDKQNAINYTVPFVFVWEGNKFVLDEEVYSGIYGLISLTVADVRAYIKSPDKMFDILNNRYNPDPAE